MLLEMSLTIALAVVLKQFTLWHMPFGGDISLAMLPILVFALRRGVGPGLAAGAVFGVIDYFFEPFFFAWVQVALDYPIAYALLGLAGLGAASVRASVGSGGASAGARRIPAAVAVIVVSCFAAGLGRFAAHFISGVVFFGANAPKGQPVWLYSLVYNATYVVPSIVACTALAVLIVPLLQSVVPVREARWTPSS
jgi:thiamine transporter